MSWIYFQYLRDLPEDHAMDTRTLPAERRLAIDELEREILDLTARQTAGDYALLVKSASSTSAPNRPLPACEEVTRSID